MESYHTTIKRTSLGIAAAAALVASLMSGGTVQAAPQYALDCTKCHSMPPSDSADGTRNPATGSVKGNHDTHVDSVTFSGNLVVTCVKCHGNDVNTYTSGHSDQVITMRQNIFSSAAKGVYKRPGDVTFFNQSSLAPNATLGSCSNVSCHFESTSPVWGTAVLGAPSNSTCSTCHSSSPVTDSHAKHIAEYATSGAITACVKCHSDHTAEAKPFAHATSVGRPIDVAGDHGYTGTADKYLPSQIAERVNGSCDTAYCHGDGRGNLKPSPEWGQSVARCTACHDSRPLTGSHTTHLVGAHVACADCHKGAVEGADLPDRHDNGNVDVYKATQGDLGYPATRPVGGVIFESCATASCHVDPSTVTAGVPAQQTSPVWGDATQPKCTICHSVSPTTGSHTAHFNAGFSACNSCHVNADAINYKVPDTHNNNMIDVGKTASGDYGYPSPKAIGSAYGTCTTGSCHADGRGNFVSSPKWGNTVADCTACHAKLPNTGSHVQHITGIGITCNKCHTGAIEGTTAPNTHMNNTVDVTITNAANTATVYTVSKAIGSPAESCNNVYCHGRVSPTWGGNTNSYQCTKCHGLNTVLAAYSSVSNRQAVPGYMGVGRGVGQQTGTVTSNVSDDPKVGAHDVHIRSTNNIGKPAGCSDCHVVPATAFSAGHMDGSALPTWSNLVKNSETIPGSAIPYTYASGALTPNYDSVTGTCSNIYCHGATLPAGDSAKNTTPKWTETGYITGDRANDCSKCHGYPPTQSARLPHTPAANYMTCSGCHPHNGTRESTDPLVPNDLHMDGNLQASKYCNTCHDYDTRGTDGSTWGKNSIAVEGFGAHAMHINYLKKRMNKNYLNPNVDVFDTDAYNGVCGICHTRLQSNHEQANRTTSIRNITFGDISSVNRQFGPNLPLYNGTTGVSSATQPKTCSNVDCHYKTSPIWQPY